MSYILPIASDITLGGVKVGPGLAIAPNGTLYVTANPVADGDYSDITISSNGTIYTIKNGVVTNAKLANMANLRVKGNFSGGASAPTDVTMTTLLANLSAFVGDSGSGGTKGLVPAPAAGDAAASKFLSAGGTWEIVMGTAAVWGAITGTLSDQTDLQNALDAKQNTLPYVAEDSANKRTTMTGNEASNTFYLTAKAIYDWATGLFETLANKSTNVNTDQASNTKYPSVKAVYDWAVGLFVQTGSDASVKSLTITGTNGLGHVHLKHQAADATATGSSTVVFADSNGDVKTKNDGGYYSTHKTSTNTADRVYTYPNESVTLAGITQSITNGDTTKAPSADVVFDALATKAETFKGQRFTTGPVTEVSGTTAYRINTALGAVNMLAIDSNSAANARVLYVTNEDGTNTINVSAPGIEFNGGGVGNPFTIAATPGETALFLFDGTNQTNIFVKTL